MPRPAPPHQTTRRRPTPMLPKRPAGRTKLRETRHPEYRSVRRRGNADGGSARCLNFADSAWLLVVSSALSDHADVRHAALQDVANFQRWEAADGLITRTVAKEAPSSAPAQLSSESDSADSSETSEPSADGEFKLPAATNNDMFRLDIFPEMDLGSYYVSLAEALLMDPPLTAAIIDTYRDNGDGRADVPLWSY
ncbi:hypothetical protein ZWY2020_024180 [Hordeum vulgare]|nr:hypothetical protein ZWY2020_024180 [Hordeum vulgare]